MLFLVLLQVMEPVNIASLLHSLGLGKYAITFQAEEVSNLHLSTVSICSMLRDKTQLLSIFVRANYT